MAVIVKPKLKKFVEAQVKAGVYESAEDVVAAGLSKLMRDDRDFGFAPGELRELVEKGEADIAHGDTLSLSQVRQHFRHLSKSKRKSA